jgi:hypothetical protein
MTEITNKVSESGIISLDLESYFPSEGFMLFDIKEFLFMGLILKEKDYRAALLQIDFTVYQNKNVGIVCSADAIIPMWAYMLAASYIQPTAKNVMMGTEEKIVEQILLERINELDTTQFADKRVVIKGCGEKSIPESAYVAITIKLRPVTKSIMYGEPCSTVPIYKNKIIQ